MAIEPLEQAPEHPRVPVLPVMSISGQSKDNKVDGLQVDPRLPPRS